ncbi:MAG: DUF2190 family protein [Deltaproteobacteria bacterium]|nr:DUF2190 family protein [Deltaproteobacteria bacterium]
MLLESSLTHPTHADGFVDKGDPVAVGDIVGVSLLSASGATDYVTVDTEGIWYLSVVGTDDNGDTAVAIGDDLFISSSGVLSPDSSGTPFGVALGAVTSGATAVIAVKVHAHPQPGLFVDFISETVAYDDFTDNTDTTGYIDLTPTLPIGAIPLGCKFVVATGFTGDTTAVVQAGIDGDLDRFTEDTTQSVLAAGTVGAIPTSDAAAGIGAAVTVRVTVTGGADFTSISAGEMTVYVYYLRT